MFTFRPQRGSLVDSMNESVQLTDRTELEAHIGHRVLSVNKYGGIDTRIGWAETYIVVCEELGVAGFTDAPV